jgi:predicted dehydrogenase
MGRHHVRVLRDLEGVQLVALADEHGDRFRVAGPLSVGRDVEELIAAGIDLAVVAVPTALHEETALALAGAGVHTLIEKPVAPSTEAAERVSTAFLRAGVIGCVGHIERYNPAISELRRRVTAGALGSIFQISTSRLSTFPERVADVGVVMDLATHDINTTQWLTQTDYRSVAAHTAHRAGRDHEDLLSLTGIMRGDVIVSHLVSRLSPVKVRLTTVTGERGTMVADTARVTLTFWENSSAPAEWESFQQFYGVTEGDMTRFALRIVEPLKTEHEAFRDAILGRGGETVPLTDGLDTLKVAEAALASAATGETVRVND